MVKIMGMANYHRRVAINVGAGFVPGMNSVLMGAALAGGKLGWELVGIRNGFEGLLHPDQYPDGGLVPLSIERVENLDPATGGILGQAPRVDPFHTPTTNQNEADLCVGLSAGAGNRKEGKMTDRVRDKVVIVTGGVSGLGDELSKQATDKGGRYE